MGARGDTMIEYHFSMVRDSPYEFDEMIITFLKERFNQEIDDIFSEIKDLLPVDLFKQYKPKLERQIFPALLFSENLTKDIKHDVVEYCKHFITIALPILFLDKWIDTDKDIVKTTESVECFFLQSLVQMELVSNKKELYSKINQHIIKNSYLEILTMHNERNHRYEIPPTLEILVRKEYYSGKELIDFSSFNRSVGRLFTSIIGGCLYLVKTPHEPAIWEMLRLYDVIRQVINEISDTEEDLNNGILTFPIIHYLESSSIKRVETISKEWENKGKFPWLDSELIRTESFSYAFRMVVSLYDHCFYLKEKLISTFPFLDNIFVLYDLKLALAYRLKIDGWKDRKKCYV
jgi:hypothetical protein